MRKSILFTFLLLVACVNTGSNDNQEKRTSTTIWLIGDSTMADYTHQPDYVKNGSIIAGWGQVFQQFVSGKYLDSLQEIVHSDSVIVRDKAIGGRTSRSFFEEGRWRTIYDSIQPGDIVIIQFGHNDASIRLHELLAKRGYPEFVDLGYKEYLRLYVSQTREKGGTPILLTPVARNYPWKNDSLSNIHGKFPESVKIVADEMNVQMIDLNQLSIDFFTSAGQEYVTWNYFMNIPEGKYEAYPEGVKDNTHFQMEGAIEVARLVYLGMKNLSENQ